jgi:hypothetical protein
MVNTLERIKETIEANEKRRKERGHDEMTPSERRAINSMKEEGKKAIVRLEKRLSQERDQ